MVQVRTKYDLIDPDTSELLLSAGTLGTVVATQRPPAPPTFQIEFDLGSVTLTKWMRGEDLVFEDGDLGKVRAFLEGDDFTIDDIFYPEKISATDLIVDERLSARKDKVRITFLEGYYLDLVSDRNTGEFTFTFDKT